MEAQSKIKPRLHFMGIGGSGISGVSQLSKKFGYEVSGCDLEDSTAYSKDIVKGHSASHVKDADLVVVSPAVLYQNSDNPEVVEAKKLEKLMTWQEFLGKVLLKDKKVIAIAGTHGKSTTTAMAGKMLIDNDFDPIVVLGAHVPEWNGNSRFGNGEYAVIEADEFNNNFLNYSPDIAIINNIEFDHPDFFEDEGQVEESFQKFITNLKGEKILITQEDSLNKKFNLKILGAHNQKNANMVYLLGRKLGIKDADIVRSIESFTGIGRRLELVAHRGGVKVYDDYAHHPTAIKATLEAVREEYPKAKILVIDEPHGYKRTKALLSNYKGVFDAADKVIIGPIFQARDEKDISITPELVAKTSGHKNVIGVNRFDSIIENCKLILGNYNIVVVMGAGKSYLWAREIANLLPVSFSEITSFRIGGTIKKYFKVKNENEIKDAIEFAKENKLLIFIIGDGTDILVSDKDFNSVVIKYIGENYKLQMLNAKLGQITAEAGMNWDKLVEYAVENGLEGIESLSGIPGTVGAAPIQNIGAYGSELKDVFVNLEAYDIYKNKIVKFSKKDCEFGYRESVFKKEGYWQKYIILNITLELSKNNFGKVNYQSLAKYISSEKPTILEVRNAVLKIRAEKLENPKEIGNAGSFFKNPIVSVTKKESLVKMYPEIITFPFENKFKISAAWLIDKAGWKGKSYKNAGVSPKHALILINKTGKANARDVYSLSQKIIDDIYKKFRIKLEREVQLINF